MSRINPTTSQLSPAPAFKGKKKPEKNCEEKKNILHDTPLRYTGYFDDIGAAVRVVCNNSANPVVKAIPALSYIPVAAYIGADVYTTYKDAKQTDGKEIAKKKATSQLIFQVLTSLVAPIAVVALAQKGGGKVLDKFVPSMKQMFDKDGNKIINHGRDVALALMGLGGLVAASKPIDFVTEKVVMNKVINPLLGLNKEGKKAETPVSQAEPTFTSAPVGDAANRAAHEITGSNEPVFRNY